MTSGPKAPTTTTTSSAGAAVTAAVKAVALSGGAADDKPRGACHFWEHLVDVAEVIFVLISTAGMASTRRTGALGAVERGT